MDLIGPLQVRVMHHLWKHGPSTVHDVHSALNAKLGTRPLAYTTVLTVMRNLSRRKILSQRPQGRAHIFEPLIDEQSYKLSMLRHVRSELFAGDVDTMLRYLTLDEGISAPRRQSITACLVSPG